MQGRRHDQDRSPARSRGSWRRPDRATRKSSCYAAKYPKHPDGPQPPADATPEHYRQLQHWIGTERVVVVQANAYGDDNRCTMDAVAELGIDKARAVVVVKPGVKDAELERLTKAGARGLRIMCLPGGHLKWDVMDEMVARVRPFGWHPIIQFDGREFPEREAQLERIAGDYVIDHPASSSSRCRPIDAAFKVLLGLVGRGNCYVRLRRMLRDLEDRQTALCRCRPAGQGADQGCARPHRVGLELAAHLGPGRAVSRRRQPARPAARMGADEAVRAQNPGRQSSRLYGFLGGSRLMRIACRLPGA